MKRILNIVPFLLLGSMGYGQLVNQGGTITIQPGATLVVESDLSNNSVGGNTGTIIVKGELNVKGDYTNNAMVTTDPGSLVIFSGDANSNVLTGGTIFENVRMAKDHVTDGTITLMDSMHIKTNLDFNPATGGNINKMVLAGFDLIFTDAAATISDADAANYIDADAVGMVEKPFTADGMFTFPVGGSSYSPITTEVSGSSYTDGKVRINLVEAVHPNKPTGATDFISRYWNVIASGIADYKDTLTGSYVVADVTGVAGDIQGAVYNSTPEWTYDESSNGATLIKSYTEDSNVDFTGTNTFNTVEITAIQQALLEGSTIMTNYLQQTDFLPTSDPFSVGATYADINNEAGVAGNVVDWVKVEVRDAANPATIHATKALLLQTDGDIVDVDGSIPVFKGKSNSVLLTVIARNHLPIVTNSIAAFNGESVTYDFTTGLGQASNPFGDPSQMILTNGVWCMIAGDSNGDFVIDGIDLTQTRNDFNAGIFDGYFNTDYNMDTGVDGIDLTLDRIAFNNGYYSTLLNY